MIQPGKKHANRGRGTPPLQNPGNELSNLNRAMTSTSYRGISSCIQSCAITNTLIQRTQRMFPMARMLAALMLLVALSPLHAHASDAEDRAEIQEMRQKTLNRLYQEEPETRDMISRAYGYAVFGSGGINAFFISAAYGSGVAHNNREGADTYMKMASGGVGIGLGIKDYRLVFVFHSPQSYEKFVKEGWDLSGQADAAAKAGTDGGELSGAGTVVNGVTVYQLTENGLALQATIQGTKYWADDDLNY